MKRRRLLIFGVLASLAVSFFAWRVSHHLRSRLIAVEIEFPGGELMRTEAPEFLREVEAWRHTIEGPSLRQRWLRFTGKWIEPGVRGPNYEVTLVFENGRREQLAVWVYAKDYVPVYTARWSGTSGGRGYSCLARSEPFTAFAQPMQRREPR